MSEQPTVSEKDIQRLVETFYGRVRRDPLLGPVFARAIGTGDAAWEVHFATLRAFWSSVMLGSRRYKGDPFSVHLRLPELTPDMFERWLALFGETCDALFPPEAADAFRAKAERIARSLRLGLFDRPGLPDATTRSASAPAAAHRHPQAGRSRH